MDADQVEHADPHRYGCSCARPAYEKPARVLQQLRVRDEVTKQDNDTRANGDDGGEDGDIADLHLKSNSNTFNRPNDCATKPKTMTSPMPMRNTSCARKLPMCAGRRPIYAPPANKSSPITG